MQRAQLPLYLGRGFCPVDAAIIFRQHIGINRAVCRLLLRREGLVLRYRRQRLHNQLPALFCQRVMQALRGGRGGDRHFAFQQHGARIQPRFHLHDADAAFIISRQYRALDGRGPAPARQQGAVDIDAAIFWRIQNILRQNQPVGGNNRDIKVQVFEGLPRFGIFLQ